MNAASWRVVAGSVAGPQHANVELSNQDSVRQRMLPGGLHALAVADGAGPAARATLGSNFAVEAAIAAAVRCFPEPPVGLAGWRSATLAFADECLSGFDEEVAHAGGPRADYSTTLLAVILAPPFLAYVCVGGCFLVAQRDPGGSSLVVAPRAVLVPAAEPPASAVNPGLSGAVYLTSPHRDEDLRHGVLADTALSGVALGTGGVVDGMLRAAYAPDGSAYHVAPAGFDEYFDTFRDDAVDARVLSRRLRSREFAASSGDDKTLLMAVRR
ncbi:protein phosphatase 2C domain-containing protein [Actinoplanes sp. NPDC051633]|uniref:protein phosphatase 2C domain-containing protein n=1 Tax=Actinoplanes sp. NPDC051633 TaxID=3155670 RepID=UPI0034421C95